MRGVTTIEVEWLARNPHRHVLLDLINSSVIIALLGPLVTYGAPLELPRPRYDAAADVVMCHVSPTAGPRLWKVSRSVISFVTMRLTVLFRRVSSCLRVKLQCLKDVNVVVGLLWRC